MRYPVRFALSALVAFAGACSGAASARTDTSTVRGAADSGATDSRVTRADLARIAGDTAAKVWLIVVSDFQCPYCKLYHDSAGSKIQREYVETGKIRLAYLNYPLSQHPHAVPAAEAAMCAGAQGKFWAFHDSLFATQTEWARLGDGTPVFNRIAKGTAVDEAAYTKCVSDHVMQPMIQADYARGSAQGVRGTPTFFVDSRRIDNTYSYTALKPILDSAVAAAAARRGDR